MFIGSNRKILLWIARNYSVKPPATPLRATRHEHKMSRYQCPYNHPGTKLCLADKADVCWVRRNGCHCNNGNHKGAGDCRHGLNCWSLRGSGFATPRGSHHGTPRGSHPRSSSSSDPNLLSKKLQKAFALGQQVGANAQLRANRKLPVANVQRTPVQRPHVVYVPGPPLPMRPRGMMPFPMGPLPMGPRGMLPFPMAPPPMGPRGMMPFPMGPPPMAYMGRFL